MKKFALIHQKDGNTILGTDQYIPLDGRYSYGYVKPSDVSPWRFSTKADEDFFIKNGNR